MKMSVKADRTQVDDGLHQGAIIAIEQRTVPYEYTDIIIEFGDNRLKCGYPSMISPSSKLGQLLTNFGSVLEVGEDIDIEQALVGKVCQFMTLKKEGKNKRMYASVLPDSVKPAGKKK